MQEFIRKQKEEASWFDLLAEALQEFEKLKKAFLLKNSENTQEALLGCSLLMTQAVRRIKSATLSSRTTAEQIEGSHNMAVFANMLALLAVSADSPEVMREGNPERSASIRIIEECEKRVPQLEAFIKSQKAE